MTKHCTACGIELPPKWRGPRLCEMCRSLEDVEQATERTIVAAEGPICDLCGHLLYQPGRVVIFLRSWYDGEKMVAGGAYHHDCYVVRANR